MLKKLFLMSAILVTGLSSFAKSNIDLTKVSDMTCRRADWRFHLSGLQSKNPKYTVTRTNPIKIKKVTSHSLVFELVYEGQVMFNHTINLTDVGLHQDVDNQIYQTLKGTSQINKEEPVGLECIVK